MMGIGLGLILSAFIMIIELSDCQAQSWVYRIEYQHAKDETLTDRTLQSEDEAALRAFREFRYSLIRSLKRSQSPKELEPLEDHWRQVKPH